MERGDDPLASRDVSGPDSGVMTTSEIGETASQHGYALHTLGYTIDQVVNDYSDVCQAITGLAEEHNVPFQIDEYRTLNRCLDTAISRAVMEFSDQRTLAASREERQRFKAQLGELAHELRNALGNATMAFLAAKSGALSLTGATGTVLEQGLATMQLLIDRSLEEVKESEANSPKIQTYALADFLTEVAHAANLAAQVRGVKFTALTVDKSLAFRADRDALYSALGNVLQNAFKFTRPRSAVVLSAHAAAGRIYIDVKDHCGGLAPDAQKTMFEPFMQQSPDRSGLGLGLTITKKIVESFDGVLSVKNRPGVGCIFTINLPRHVVDSA